ncbi:hypothetical protein WA1_18165 [Scytonema hofmannii PCC 7110]|uniref:SWIM zinc finger domain-containing protein n=1 Tax=Scytonema hofmannii PCC 7110 TaxID=128403 RepID=A0A139XBE8_9CYAN|nr:hypothetical protein WA1_18165 [Scytonema hofmannii PCC 7110]
MEQHSSLEKLLDCLDHVQTQRLVQELVAKHPELMAEIKHHVSLMTHPVVNKTPSELKRHITTVDPKPYRQQVRQILRDAARYMEDGYEEDPISEELYSVVQSAVDLCERGDSNNALVILEAITSTCVDNWIDVEEYGAENEEIVSVLNDAWCEAILTTELIPEEKVDIQVNLETWQNEWDADFELALEALRQGWNDPLLIEVLQGKITANGVWEGEPPDCADDLALIRLKILEREERYEEYLYLAQAEGQTERYLTMLGRLGRIEEAMDAAQTQMSSMEEAFALAKTLKEQESLQQALHIAQEGLKLPGNCQYDLGIWTSDLAEGLRDKQVALFARKSAFQAIPTFADYRIMEDLAGEKWEGVKTELLQILDTHKRWGLEKAKVDIFLYEGLIDDAIATVSERNMYDLELVHRVMQAATTHNPQWVITNACRYAESIMDAGKAEHYDAAVAWLKKARIAYLESGRQVEWLAYKAHLMEIHARKRKLMGLFQQLV